MLSECVSLCVCHHDFVASQGRWVGGWVEERIFFLLVMAESHVGDCPKKLANKFSKNKLLTIFIYLLF